MSNPDDDVAEAFERGSYSTWVLRVVLDAEHQLALIEEYGGMPGLGGEASAPHFASAWAHANNSCDNLRSFYGQQIVFYHITAKYCVETIF